MKINRTDLANGAVVLEAVEKGVSNITVRHLPGGKVEVSWKSLGFVNGRCAKKFIAVMQEMMEPPYYAHEVSARQSGHPADLARELTHTHELIQPE